MSDMSDEESVVWEIWDKIPDDLTLWPDGEELGAGFFVDRTYEWWRVFLGHEPSSSGRCCKTCGWAGCNLAIFHEAVAVSIIRELLRQGLIVGDFRDGSAPTA